jgi:ribosomal protein S27AE
MRCTQCAAVSYSAAARTLVEQGHRCPACGGEVALAPHELAVAVAAEGEGRAGDERSGRFDRD